MQSDPDVMSLIAPFVVDLYLHSLLMVIKRARYRGDLVALKRNGGHGEDGIRRSAHAVHRERHVGGVALDRRKEKEGECKAYRHKRHFVDCVGIFKYNLCGCKRA